MNDKIMEFSLLSFDFDIYYQYLISNKNRTVQVPLYFKKLCNYVTCTPNYIQVNSIRNAMQLIKFIL